MATAAAVIGTGLVAVALLILGINERAFQRFGKPAVDAQFDLYQRLGRAAWPFSSMSHDRLERFGRLLLAGGGALFLLVLLIAALQPLT